MEDNAGFYLNFNGVIQEASIPIKMDTSSGKAAYEVLRIIKGVPLFYQEHYDRMDKTYRSIGQSLKLSAGQLKDNIKELLIANKNDSCNVKVVVFHEDGEQRQLVYICKSHYPSEHEIEAGVRTGLFRIVRQNPNAKLINQAYKDAVNAKMLEGGYFEVILTDSADRLTEGSRSNLFIVKGENIVTAPGDFVLKGITRRYVFEACRNAGFEVTEQFVCADGLSDMDGAFLSGTSIKVLPVSKIDNIDLNSSVNPVITAVRLEYDKLLEKYIDDNVDMW